MFDDVPAGLSSAKSYAQTQARPVDPPVQRTVADEVQSQLSAVSQRLCVVNHRLEGVSDRMFGPVPRDASGAGKAESGQQCAVRAIASELDSITAIIGMIENTINRLEKIA